MKAWLEPDTSEFKDRKQCGFFLPEMLASVAGVYFEMGQNWDIFIF